MDPYPRVLLTVNICFGGPIIVRIIHYIVAWLFIVIIVLHSYLVLIEARPELPLMFFYREPREVTMSDGGEER